MALGLAAWLAPRPVLAEDEPLRAPPAAPPGPAASPATAPEIQGGSRPPYLAQASVFGEFEPKFEVSGYLRTRTQVAHDFALGRAPLATGPDPFLAYIPLESRTLPDGGCANGCRGRTLAQADFRLRIAPKLELSPDIRLYALFDAFDRVLAGSTPTSYYGSDSLGLFGASASGPHSSPPPLIARRAWAEVTKGRRGVLKFGRMPNHWGMGLVHNGADGLDDDLASDADRVELGGRYDRWYPSVSYDFVSEGFVQPLGPSGLPLDPSEGDDVHEIALAVTEKVAPGERELLLERGLPVLNFGVRHGFRWQALKTFQPIVPGALAPAAPQQVRVAARSYTPDLWLQLLYRRFRFELEAAATLGSLENYADQYTPRSYKLAQFGVANQTELRLVREKLGLYLDSGFASGDRNVEGLSSDTDFVTQQGGHRVTTFRFHPSYRVDLILWRSIMRQVTGAYYLRPGVSYDLIRDDFGQLLGGSLHVVYSRAAAAAQAPGDAHDLGVEFDVACYYRTADGPLLRDGVHARVEYALLVPMQGLSYASGDAARPSGFDLRPAQALRLILAVAY